MSGTHLKGTLRGHEGCGPHKSGFFIGILQLFYSYSNVFEGLLL